MPDDPRPAESDRPATTNATRMLVLLLLSLLLAGVAVGTSFKRHYTIAATCAVPAVVCFVLALSPSEKSGSGE
jgi:hypothetical protein